MKLATRIVLAVCAVLLHHTGFGQVANDDCGTATDITSVFESLHNGNGDWIDCNMGNGTQTYGLGSFEYNFKDATISTPIYLSDNCRGISDQTSPHLPDIWFKVAMENVNGGYLQGFEVLAFDTLEIAVYQGSCSSLIQIDCFTPAPYRYEDLIMIPDTADADTMYIQLRSNTTPVYEVFCITPVYGFLYYAASRPAIVWNGTSGISALSAPDIKIYPNPTSDYIHIESPNRFKTVEVYDLLGNDVLSLDDYENIPVPVNSLVPGTYIVRMVDTSMDSHYAMFNKN